MFPAAPRQEPQLADAPKPFKFDTPSPDDAVLLARSGQRAAPQRQHGQQQQEQAQPQPPLAAPAEQLRALRLQGADEAAPEGQSRAGIRPAEGDVPSTSGRTEQHAPQVP